MHNRTAIRNALEALLSSLTFTLFIEHPGHRKSGEFRPCAILTLTDTTVDEDRQTMRASPITHRVETCSIELEADASTGLIAAEAIDSMEEEIEIAIGSDLDLGGICEGMEMAGSEYTVNDEQDRVIVTRTLTYNIPWRAPFGAPDTPE